MKAADVMVKEVITARPDHRIEEVAHLLVTNRISGAPVIAEDGALIGIVSEGDLFRRAETGTQHRRSWWLDLLTTRGELAAEYIKEHGGRVEDVMTHKVVTVSPDSDLAEIANLLESHRIKRVPVVDGGKLVGIISRANLVQALAALHGQLPAKAGDDGNIREEVLARLRREPWRPALLNVIVKDGKVGLWGFVRTQDERDAARIAAETVPGVSAVEDNLIVMPRSYTGTY